MRFIRHVRILNVLDHELGPTKLQIIRRWNLDVYVFFTVYSKHFTCSNILNMFSKMPLHILICGPPNLHFFRRGPPNNFFLYRGLPKKEFIGLPVKNYCTLFSISCAWKKKPIQKKKTFDTFFIWSCTGTHTVSQDHYDEHARYALCTETIVVAH